MKPTTQQQPTIKKKHCGMKNLMLTGLKKQKRSKKKSITNKRRRFGKHGKNEQKENYE